MEGKLPEISAKPPRLAVGYECTPIGNAERIFGEPRDVLDATRHYEQFEADFDLQESLGISELRYPAGWDKILVSPFDYNFKRIAPIMESMRRRGFVPTIDLCHHKVPLKIKNGFANPEFSRHLLDFALAFQNEFPFIERYTIINEPAVTALFHSTEVGIWAKHKWSDVFLNMAEAISIVSHALKKQNPRIRFFQPEPIDHDAVSENSDAKLAAQVKFLREHGRFGMDNLLRGRVDESHPFFKRLIAKGASPERVLWFQKNTTSPYQKDLDFYVHCFKIWFRHPRHGFITHKINPNPPSLSSVINEYKSRLPDVPMGIGETNVRGTTGDRINFFKYVLEECAAANIDRVSWWGLTDADTWGNGNLTRRWKKTGKSDPVGIFTLTDDAKHGRLWTRNRNEFSEIVKAYGSGQISIEDIPAFEFSGELKMVLKRFVKNGVKNQSKSSKVLAETI